LKILANSTAATPPPMIFTVLGIKDNDSASSLVILFETGECSDCFEPVAIMMLSAI